MSPTSDAVLIGAALVSCDHRPSFEGCAVNQALQVSEEGHDCFLNSVYRVG